MIAGVAFDSLSLRLASELYFLCVYFETDCIYIVEAWKKPPSYFEYVIMDCQLLVSDFVDFDLLFVRRTKNCIADYLAWKASSFSNSIWVKEGPSRLNNFMHFDVLLSMSRS